MGFATSSIHVDEFLICSMPSSMTYTHWYDLVNIIFYLSHPRQHLLPSPTGSDPSFVLAAASCCHLQFLSLFSLSLMLARLSFFVVNYCLTCITSLMPTTLGLLIAWPYALFLNNMCCHWLLQVQLLLLDALLHLLVLCCWYSTALYVLCSHS